MLDPRPLAMHYLTSSHAIEPDPAVDLAKDAPDSAALVMFVALLIGSYYLARIVIPHIL